jgi:ribonuclease HI
VAKICLTTDGSCIGNPGPGGWACILRSAEFERELIGRDPHTTNNRMELKAAIEGLAAPNEPSEVEVVTDSEYLLRGVTERLARWKSNGWKTAVGKVVQNQDLWRELDELIARHKVRWTGYSDMEITPTKIAATVWPGLPQTCNARSRR